MNRQIDYALQFIFALSQAKSEVISIAKFCQDSSISFLFMQKIAKKLREAGIIEATKGSAGGYTLTQAMETINLAQIIEAIEGPSGMTTCTKIQSICEHAGNCKLKSGIERISAQIGVYLQSIKLSEFV